MKALLVITLLSLSSLAVADQCAFVKRDQAQHAVKLIQLSMKNAGGVLQFCEPCRDTAPTELLVRQIDIASTGNRALPAQIALGGEGIDLAYTYVKTGSQTWANLSKLVGCPSKYVRTILTR